MKNQKGFTLVEGLLIVLILTVIGFAGYYVWNENKSEEAEPTSGELTQNEEPKDNDSENKDVSVVPSYSPEGYIDYIDANNRFAFSSPEEWGQYSMESPPEGLDVDEFYKSAPVNGNISRVSVFTVNPRDTYTLGGGFGPEMKVSEEGVWTIVGGRYSEERIGETVELESTVNEQGVKVFSTRTGDGPFSQSTLVFILDSDEVVEISLPSVCPDIECSNYEGSYTQESITNFMSEITKSITVSS